jgi:hypothetical protein
MAKPACFGWHRRRKLRWIDAAKGETAQFFLRQPLTFAAFFWTAGETLVILSANGAK